MVTETKKLTAFLHHQIPLSEALGVKVITANRQSSEIFAPLEPNRNHMGSAFGGSISALLILAGYTWLYHFLEEEGFKTHVILKSCETNYLLPIEKDLKVVCRAPAQKELTKFLESFKRKDLSRLYLHSEILIDDQVAASMKGEFVARKSVQGSLG